MREREREGIVFLSIFTATSPRTISPGHIETVETRKNKRENWEFECDPAAFEPTGKLIWPGIKNKLENVCARYRALPPSSVGIAGTDS